MAACTASAPEEKIAKCVELLLSRNADPNVSNNPDGLAATRKTEIGCKNQGVWNNLEFHHLWTFLMALMYAVQYGREGAVLKLIELGAGITTKTKEGMMAADIAKMYRHSQISAILASPQSQSGKPEPLSKEETLFKFFKRDPEPTPDPSESCCKFVGDMELLLHGLKLEHLTETMLIGITNPEDQKTVLTAIKDMQLDKVELDQLTELGNFDHSSELVLDWDPKMQSQSICDELVEQIGDLHKEATCLSNLLNKALMYAVQYGREGAVLKLIELGAGITTKTKEGMMAADIAKMYRHSQISAILASPQNQSGKPEPLSKEETLFKFFKRDPEPTPDPSESCCKFVGDMELLLHGLKLEHLTETMLIGITNPEDQKTVLTAIKDMQLDKVELDQFTELGNFDHRYMGRTTLGSQVMCDNIPGLVNKQRQLCSCEAAFVYAISSAGVVYSLTRACSQGELESCSCDPKKKGSSRDSKGTFDWGGCSDNIDYGIQFAQAFVDARERKERDARALMNLHNNRAGRKAVKRFLKLECKCHGVSGSCTVRTCWLAMADFRKTGDYLRRKYNGAIQVVMNQYGTGFTVAYKKFKKPTKNDLVYFENSPDYCIRDHEADFRKTGDYLRRKYNGAIQVVMNQYGTGFTVAYKKFKKPTKNDLVYFENSPDYCIRDHEADFRKTGDYLRRKYNGAIQVVMNQYGTGFTVAYKKFKKPTKNDLVYFENSPDYCIRDHEAGSLGTAGRICNLTSRGADSCEVMCCGRGYDTETVFMFYFVFAKNIVQGSLGTAGRICNLTSRGADSCEVMCCGRGYDTASFSRMTQCECKFHWCCAVHCKDCHEVVHVQTCKALKNTDWLDQT
ncbi:UNVERIFIED_CONTAM: hypothetical protein FKN15_035099 [Acipenser sinensis]